jgi:hypothetical protein
MMTEAAGTDEMLFFCAHLRRRENMFFPAHAFANTAMRKTQLLNYELRIGWNCLSITSFVIKQQQRRKKDILTHSEGFSAVDDDDERRHRSSEENCLLFPCFPERREALLPYIPREITLRCTVRTYLHGSLPYN